MSSDSSGLTDEVSAELNPMGAEPGYGPQPDPIPDRPADGASKDAWVGYVVALGADRTYVTGETEHFERDAYVIDPGLTRAQLIELADRLGG